MVGIVRRIDQRLPVDVADGVWIAVKVALSDRGDGPPCWILEFACPGIDDAVSRAKPDQGEKARAIGGTIKMCFGQAANGPIELREKIFSPEIGDLGLFRGAT